MIEQIRYYLKEGLWSLAEELVFASQCQSVDPALKTEVKQFLWNLASDSASNRFLSPAVKTLWEQNWLAAGILNRLPQAENDSVSSSTELDSAKKEVEFNILLRSLFDHTPDSEIFEELSLLYSQIIRADKVKNPAQCFSPAAHNFLCNSFIKSPCSTNAVVQKLLCLWCSHFKGTDDELQGIYKEVMWHCIQTLENEHNQHNNSVELFSTLFSIIALLRVSEEKEQSLLEWLCPRLLYLFESGILPRRLAYLAFISRGKSKWLQILNSVENEYYDRNSEKTDLATLERICGRLVGADGEVNVVEIFYRAVTSEKHFIEDFLDLNSKLLVSGLKDLVIRCLSHPLLDKLWPLMILHTWNSYSEHKEIFTILKQLIEKYKEIGDDPDFTHLCVILEGHLKVVEWCKRNRRGKLVSNRDLLMLTKEHSTLEVMRRTTNLAEVDWLQITQILEHNHSLYKSAQIDDDVLHPKWDVATFNGFCIMMVAFKSILAAVEIQTLCKKMSRSHDSLEKDVRPLIPAYFAHTYPTVVLHHPALETQGEYSDHHIVQMAYTEQVTKRLSTLKEMICSLFPLNFRLEILENLFSLLFLRYKDFQDEILSDSAGEDEDVEPATSKDLNDVETAVDSKSTNTEKHQTKVSQISIFPLSGSISISPQLQTIPLIEAQVSGLIQSQLDASTHTEHSDLVTQAQDIVVPGGQTVNPSDLSPPLIRPLNSSHSPASPSSPPPSLHIVDTSLDAVDVSPSNSRHSKNEPTKSSSVETKFAKRRRIYSGATSIASMSENTGFICNEFFVRDFLNCLKECLIDTSAAYYSSLSRDTEQVVSEVPSTVNSESVKQNMTRLLQYVSEAAWRLQLLTDTNFAKQVGVVSSVELSGSPGSARSEWVYQTEETDSERGGSASGSSYRKARRKSKARCQTLLPLPTATVNLMLSPPPSLVVQCLTRGDLVKAKQVIHMCGMEETPLAVEVRFTEGFQKLCDNLRERSAEGEVEVRTRTTGFAHQQQNVVTPSLAFLAIKQAASAGVQSLAFMRDVDSFVSNTSLPSVPGAATISKEVPQAANCLRGADNNSAMAAVDLTLTVGSTYQHSVSLLDVAIKHCSLLQVVQPSTSSSSSAPGHKHRQPPGFVAFTHQMIDLAKEVNKEQTDQQVSSLFPHNTSLSRIITSPQFPLVKKVFMDQYTLWHALQASVCEFQATLKEDKKKLKDQLTSGVVLTPGKRNNMRTHLAFKKLLDASCAMSLQTDSSKWKEVKPTPTVERRYLEQLYVYVKLMSSLIIHNLPREKYLPGPVSYFDVLNERPCDLIGRMVFEYGVLPAKLEPFAARMRLDLAYNIVCNCCPKIQASASPFKLSDRVGNGAVTWGRVILNETHNEWTNPVRHPEVTVRSLLSDLLEIVRLDSNSAMPLQILTYDHACLLATHPAVKSVLAETRELASIDLTLLTPGDETLVFYANLTNLLWIHSVISLEAVCSKLENDDISSRKDPLGLLSCYSLERLFAQKSVGYNLGQLGFVSLHELETRLLGQELSAGYSTTLLTSEQMTDVSFWDNLAKSRDPRVLFALTNGQRLSPKVQVFFVENVDMQLESSMVEYFNFSVHIDDEHCLVVPERLSRYREHVMENQEPESQTVDEVAEVLDISVEAKENLTSLVDFLRDNTSGQLQRALIDCANNMKREVEVTVDGGHLEFGITFEYQNIGRERNQADNGAPRHKQTEATWRSHVIEEPVLKFLERHCWLLSVLVNKIHQDESLYASQAISLNTDERMHSLEQLFQSSSVSTLEAVYDDGSAVAALHVRPTRSELWSWLDRLAMEKNWSQCFDVLWALPQRFLMSDPKLQALNDFVVYKLASKPFTEEDPAPWRHCDYIGDISMQAYCVLNNLHHWSDDGCKYALHVLLGDTKRRLKQDVKDTLKNKLQEVCTYDQILLCCPDLNGETWHDISILSKNKPGMVLKALIRVKEPKLCLEWAELQHVSTRSQFMVNAQFLMLLLDTQVPDFSAAAKLLTSVLPIQAVAVCEDLLQHLTSLLSLSFVVNLLLDSYSSVLNPDDLLRHRHLAVGVQMLSVISAREQAECTDLVHWPRLIVEQFVMTTRLDALERMLAAVQPLLVQLPISSPVSLNSIDGLLRQYAEKALDFRVIHPLLSPCPTEVDEKLLISLSMGSTCSEEFVMPVNVPDKTQWVPNDAVTECMCCDAVAFSMFNRRHHCRRCGRVICGSCSTRRIKVPGYGDVAVRVCNGCHDCSQGVAHGSDRSSVASSRSTSHQGSFNLPTRDSHWRLSANEAHNATVREEFAYEHAPSVSLCLGILKLHSEQTAYPRFLLDSCDKMLQLLQPVRPGTLNREVDHGLVIRMVRALIVAAKVKYARSGLNTGVAHCDQLLSQADLLSDLVRSDCSSLIPGEALNGHALRRLRDRLVEEELWSLAMDVSTKGGLDRSGVWAAWGKATLRTGRWREARLKFSHCLDKVSDAPRPQRNPPLLKEIIHILESGAYAVDTKVLHQAEKINTSRSGEDKSILVPSPALTILHTLSSLKSISQGKYPRSSTPNNMVIIGPKLDPLFYSECQYYLNTYGSHAGILGFYLGHDDLSATLRHVLQQRVDPTVFFEHVYIPCLRRGLIVNLHYDLKNLDPSLELWKLHLCYTCRHLERLGFLNVLYQVQLYMKDYVRAAMTCIRFYRGGARNYTDLAANVGHLHTAHTHLETELAESRWGVTGTQDKVSSSGSLLPMNLEPRAVDRHINTVSRQIEVTKFLHVCEGERPVLELIPELFDYLSAAGESNPEPVPTLFGDTAEKVQLAVLMILCGKNVEEGFGTAFRVIQDYHLKASQVFSLAGKKLSRDDRLSDVEQLIRCIKSSGMFPTSTMCDEVLTVCVRVRADRPEPGDIEPFVKLMTDPGNKVTAYIECRQLKAAYLQAVKFNSLNDVRRILRESERLGQTVIRNICLKKLNQQPQGYQKT